MNQLYTYIGRNIRPVELAIFLKKILFIKRKEISIDNSLKFYVDPISDFGLRLIDDGVYEPQITELIKNILKKGDVFIDIGANEGFFSILGSKLVGEGGKVFAIEPQQRLLKILQTNKEKNKAFNLKICQFALGQHAGRVKMNLYPTLNSGASTLNSSFNFKTSFNSIRKVIWGVETVSIITLDQFILKNNIEKIDLIKIDVEGFEYDVIMGATDVLSKNLISTIYIEYHDHVLAKNNITREMIKKKLIGFGYFVSKENDGLFTIKGFE